MKLGFIGFGNMATAIAGGILKAGLVAPQEIAVYDIFEPARQQAEKLGFAVLSSETELVTQAEFVFLCVKPQSFTALLEQIKPVVTPKNVFLTIAAGVTMHSIETALEQKVAIIRAMPNTPLLVGCGAVALTANEAVTAVDLAFLRVVFESVGTVYMLPEALFNEIINVNGSTPAYIYLFAKTIVAFAQRTGIPQEIAMPMFCDTLKGAAAMLTQTGKSPDELIAMVSSKGGTTVAALGKFEETGFSESLCAGMQACLDRARELAI